MLGEKYTLDIRPTFMTTQWKCDGSAIPEASEDCQRIPSTILPTHTKNKQIGWPTIFKSWVSPIVLLHLHAHEKHRRRAIGREKLPSVHC